MTLSVAKMGYVLPMGSQILERYDFPFAFKQLSWKFDVRSSWNTSRGDKLVHIKQKKIRGQET